MSVEVARATFLTNLHETASRRWNLTLGSPSTVPVTPMVHCYEDGTLVLADEAIWADNCPDIPEVNHRRGKSFCSQACLNRAIAYGEVECTL